MRVLAIAAAALALTVVSAQAQMGGGGRRHANEGQKADNTPKVDEKAYKAALERIPDPKEKYDPWGGARPSEPAKKPK
jgi:hypothetical protein